MTQRQSETVIEVVSDLIAEATRLNARVYATEATVGTKPLEAGDLEPDDVFGDRIGGLMDGLMLVCEGFRLRATGAGVIYAELPIRMSGLACRIDELDACVDSLEVDHRTPPAWCTGWREAYGRWANVAEGWGL